MVAVERSREHGRSIVHDAAADGHGWVTWRTWSRTASCQCSWSRLRSRENMAIDTSESLFERRAHCSHAQYDDESSHNARVSSCVDGRVPCRFRYAKRSI